MVTYHNQTKNFTGRPHPHQGVGHPETHIFETYPILMQKKLNLRSQKFDMLTHEGRTINKHRPSHYLVNKIYFQYQY